jgi:hypothetical protein
MFTLKLNVAQETKLSLRKNKSLLLHYTQTKPEADAIIPGVAIWQTGSSIPHNNW